MRRSLPSFEMLKPRNLRSSGRAIALLASLTFSRSFLIRNRLTEVHTLAGAAAANVDVAVIRVTAKAVTPSGQLPVEFVEHEVAQEGRERAALRRPLVHRADQAVFHHSGLEKRPDELEHTFVGHPRGDARHQAVMIDPVEKF